MSLFDLYSKHEGEGSGSIYVCLSNVLPCLKASRGFVSSAWASDP